MHIQPCSDACFEGYMKIQKNTKITGRISSIALVIACTSSAFAIIPNPIISLGKPTYSNAANPSNATDGNGTTDCRSHPSDSTPFYIAINLGETTATRVLLMWDTHGGWSYWVTESSPADYTIALSSNSTNGADGDWTTVVTVTGNPVKARSHSFDLNGNTWVRMSMTAGYGTTTTRMGAIDLYDISDGCEDYWVFLGNSITCEVFNTIDTGGAFMDLIAQARPAYTPCVLPASKGGFTSRDIRDNLGQIIEMNPDAKYYALCIGTNDGNLSDFEVNVQAIIDSIKDAGAVPVLARTFATRSGKKLEYAEKCDELTAANDLIPGPDFFTIFNDHTPEYFKDELHPSAAGVTAFHQAWADAVIAAGLYGRQTALIEPEISRHTANLLQEKGPGFTARNDDDIVLKAFNLNGRLVYSHTKSAGFGQRINLNSMIESSGLSPGTYLVFVQNRPVLKVIPARAGFRLE